MVLEDTPSEYQATESPPPSPGLPSSTTGGSLGGHSTSSNDSTTLSAGSGNFIVGGATMSSGSDGSTKYMLRDATPVHSNRMSVMSMGRSRNERAHHSVRTPTPEASRYEPNFMLGPPSSEYSKYDSCYTIRPASPKTSKKSESRYMVRPKLRPDNRSFDPRIMLQPPTPEMPRSFETRYTNSLRKDGKQPEAGTLYDSYWHIPRASLWCSNKGCVYDTQPCTDCQWKDECSSTCSSVNPPPTFTALDNYRPVRPRPKCHQCSCGIIFAITTIFSLLVLLLITGFIIYIEMVLKHQTANVTDRM
ncbi:uncharacterized protein LOC121872671 isoform X2 [Homarus americanus]|uniref:uncharacterized protein LOC121872671 isoform X2 n=1 Tax=Homarus americanus TaxID=6706 RepID=UPI001C481372|nr:uncharacterized protein LOC121872671 isoform X2 [Homarus americanus]